MSTPRFRAIAAALLASAALFLAVDQPAQAASTVTATGTFTAANDTVKPTNDTKPRGTVTFSQTDGGAISYVISVTGLNPTSRYVTVPYLDGACAPTPGVTAYPSQPFTTDGNGAANATGAVNATAINPLGNALFSVDKTRSTSIREVLAPSQSGGPITTPNVPFPITETCDGAPVVSGAGGGGGLLGGLPKLPGVPAPLQGN